MTPEFDLFHGLSWGLSWGILFAAIVFYMKFIRPEIKVLKEWMDGMERSRDLAAAKRELDNQGFSSELKLLSQAIEQAEKNREGIKAALKEISTCQVGIKTALAKQQVAIENILARINKMESK